MNAATATLRHEHEAILKMLDATERAARDIDRGEPASAEILGGLLEFFKVFADRCHHGKEEDLLFPFLERKGLPRTGGPIGVMLLEHERGRELIRNMSQAVTEFSAGNGSAARRWAAAAQEYTALLRAHINKENNILFVLAERVLSESEQGELQEAFEKLEVEKIGAGVHERLHASMAKLQGQIFHAEAQAR